MKKWIKLIKEWNGKAAGEQIEVDSAVADTLISAKLAEAIEDPTKNAVDEARKTFDETIKAVAKQTAEETIKELVKPAAGKKGSENRPAVIISHDKELEDPRLGFKSAGEFFYILGQAHGVGTKGSSSARDAAHKRIFGDGGYVKLLGAAIEAKAITGQSEAIDSEGGLFVMPQISSEIMMLEAQLADLRPYCRGFQMEGLEYEIPARIDKDHTSSVAGGITVSRKPEGVAPEKSKAKFEMIRCKATKLTGYTALTDELMSDARAFATLFPGFFAEAIASHEEGDFTVAGAGAGEPLGAFHANNPALHTINKDAGQAAGTLTITNVLNMRAACYGYQNAIWMASQDIIPSLATMVIGTMPVWLPSAKEDVPDTLLGRPIRWTEWASTIGTLNDIMLMNGREYAIADRTGIESASSMHVRFLEGEQVIKFWRRGDGRPLWAKKMTTIKGSTRSPFVNLQAR